jgi:hypothetical protein
LYTSFCWWYYVLKSWRFLTLYFKF